MASAVTLATVLVAMSALAVIIVVIFEKKRHSNGSSLLSTNSERTGYC